MRSKIDDYLDIEIPEINGKNGIGRKIALWKIRRNKPGKDAIYMIRFYLENRGKKGLKKFFSSRYKRKLVKNYGIYLNVSNSESLGIGLKIPHPSSIIIGSGTVIGRYCTIYQDVTFGAKSLGAAETDSYPKVGDNCVFYAGAKIIGNINVADGTQVGANAVLLKDTQAEGIYVGIPAKKIGKND